MSVMVRTRLHCPKCRKPLNDHGEDGWECDWGYWTQIAGDQHGGVFEIMASHSSIAGLEALRVTCPRCGFEHLVPLVEP